MRTIVRTALIVVILQLVDLQNGRLIEVDDLNRGKGEKAMNLRAKTQLVLFAICFECSYFFNKYF